MLCRLFAVRLARAGCLLLFVAFAQAGENDVVPGGPYDRGTAYLGGLSRQLFNGDRNDVTIATEVFFREISKRIGYKAEFVVHSSLQDIRNAMQNDRLDAIFANPIDYLEIDSQISPDHRYTIAFSSGASQRVLLLTRVSGGDLTQMRGKRLVLPEGHILGMTFLEVYLARAGLPSPEEFFSSITYTKDSNAAVLDLYFNKADMAVTSDIAYSLAGDLNPQVAKKIRVMTSSDPYIPFVIGLNNRVPDSLLGQVNDLLLNAKQEPKLRHILSLFYASDVVKVSPEQINSLRALKQEHRRLLAGGDRGS